MEKSLEIIRYKLLLLLIGIFTSILAEPENVSIQDSMANLLKKASSDTERLRLLTDLSDIDFQQGDSTYILSCWNEAVKQKDFLVMDEIAVPMFLRYQAQKNPDSVSAWFNRALESFEGDWIKSNKEFMILMSDIRKYSNYEDLAEKLRLEQSEEKENISPYQSMRRLYTLAVLSDMAKDVNPNLKLKTPQEYLEQAYKISNTLPYRLSVRFKRQILMGLSSINNANAQKYLLFLNDFYNQPDIRKRTYYSKYALMMAYERLISTGSELSAQTIKSYYDSLNLLIEKYPNSLRAEPVYYKNFIKFNYFKAINRKDSSLIYCDSLIRSKYRYGNNKSELYEYKCKTLGEIKDWEAGYKAALSLMNFRDSLAAVTSENKLEELQTQYELDVALNKARYQKNQLILFAIFVFVLIILLFIIIFRSIRLKATNRVLLKQLNQYASDISNKEKNNKPSQQQDQVEHMVAGETQIDSSNKSQDQANKSEELLRVFEKLEILIRNDQKYTDSDLSREMITLQLGVNKNKLSDAVYLFTGKTVREYIVDIRLDEALLLIKNDPDISLTTVADKCGFGTYSTFYRAFFKKYGVKPAEYKKYLSEE